MDNKIILMLEDGTYYIGKSFGASGTYTGEVVFNTSMTGYQEIITDPSYFGQMVVLTYSMIGNYGINFEDSESIKPMISALIVKEYNDMPSNWRSKKSLRDFLVENNVPAIEGIDTRALVRKIRNFGAMRGVISTEIFELDELKDIVQKSPKMEGLNLADRVSTKEITTYKSLNEKKRVNVIDFGIKRSIIKQFLERGISVTLFPSTSSINDVLSVECDGFFLSNGPGDPAAVTKGIELTKELINLKKPLFGICLGHQIIANAIGAKTFKMKFGHHAGNHPVKNLETGKVEITAQNHGFAVDPDSLPDFVKITHINLNDNTVEGIESKDKSWFSIQYHPEAGPGPHDSHYLFDKFLTML